MATQNTNPFVVTPESVIDSGWYVNSGASNHVANDHNSLTNAYEYGGKERVIVGNGRALPITHIGSCHIPADVALLNLHNMLCVPAIAKNLISVSKLVQNNKVFIEFHSSSCFIKDINTGQMVLKGELDDGLYIFEKTKATGSASNVGKTNLKSIGRIMACSTEVKNICVIFVSKSILHQMLGHPSSKVLNDVV